MKRWLLLIFFLVGTFSSLGLQARESGTVALEFPPELAQSLCPSPLWDNLSVQWLGTTDRRPAPQVGVETKKGGKAPIAVLTQVPLAETVDAALRRILSQCGMNLSQAPAPWRMSAVIEEFRTEVEKGLIFGKGKAKSRLVLYAETQDRKLSASAGFEIEFKKTRKKSLQRLTETLNELLRETLRQVPLSPQLRNMRL